MSELKRITMDGNTDIERFIVNPDDIYLEKAKKEFLIDIYQRGIAKKVSIHFEVYEDAMILPARKQKEDGRYIRVGVLTSDGSYVEESAIENEIGGLWGGVYTRSPDIRQIGGILRV